jgi:hypothetical protein
LFLEWRAYYNIMTPEEAQGRAQSQLFVIETTYGITIVNRDEVINAIIEKTRDDQRILMICTALNSWVAMNAGMSPEVAIPLDVVNSLLGQVMRL